MCDIKIVRATSTFDCGGICPLKLDVKDNRIIRVEGDDLPDADEQLCTYPRKI
jgi:anaerobic dimethyl sulfoxide reductase subunit A